MKPSIAILLFAASAVACAHSSRPATPTASTAPASPTRVETAQVSESAPPASGIPRNPPVVTPPAQAAVPPPDQTPLTMAPAAGVGLPRNSSAQLVPNTPALDKGDSAKDHESIRDIRSLLASDQALSPIAAQVTILARNGRVWLRGQVTSKEQRAAIEKTARKAAWVVDVKNELVTLE